MVAIEIDGDPSRQDLDHELARGAVDEGCLFALDSDAHSTAELEYAETAIAHARLAGVPTDRIINCWPLERLLEWAELGGPSREHHATSGAHDDEPALTAHDGNQQAAVADHLQRRPQQQQHRAEQHFADEYDVVATAAIWINIMVCLPAHRRCPPRSRLSHRGRLKTGFLQSRIDLVGDPFPDVRARRQQRGDLDRRELRSGIDEHPNRRARVMNK